MKGSFRGGKSILPFLTILTWGRNRKVYLGDGEKFFRFGLGFGCLVAIHNFYIFKANTKVFILSQSLFT